MKEEYTQIKAVATVEVPLEEYKAFLEWQFKGPTVEIPLEEYNRLREEKRYLEEKIREVEFNAEDLRREIENRKEFGVQIDTTVRALADEMAKRVIENIEKAGRETEKRRETVKKYGSFDRAEAVTESDTKIERR